MNIRMSATRPKPREEGDKNVVSINDVSVALLERLILEYLEQIGWAAEAYDDPENQRRVASVTSESSLFRFLVSREPQAAIWSLSQEGSSVRLETSFRKIPSFARRAKSLLETTFVIFPFLVIFVWVLLGGGSLPVRMRDALVSVCALLIGISLCLVWVYRTRFDEWDFMGGLYRHVYESTRKRAVILQVLPSTNIHAILTLLMFIAFGIVLNKIDYAFGANPFDAEAPSGAVWRALAIDIPMAAGMLGLLPLLTPGFSEKWTAHLVSVSVGSYMTYYTVSPLLLVRVLETSSNTASVRLLGLVLVVFPLIVFTLVSFYVPWDLERRWHARSYAIFAVTANRKEAKSAAPLNYSVLAFWGLCAMSNITGVVFSLSAWEYLLRGRHQLFRITSAGVLVDAFGIPAAVLYSLPMLAIPLMLISRWLKELFKALQAEVPVCLERDVGRIAAELGITKPRIVVADDIEADAHTSRVLLLGNVLTMTKTTLELLSSDELRAVLVHELCHFKKHSLIFSLLDSLSRWSLFGKGFLTVLLNTKKMEYQADEDAVDYLVRAGMQRGRAKGILVKALDTIVIHNEVAKYFAASQMHTSRMRMFYEIYFGDRIWWYAYPTIDERVRRLEALP